MMPYLPVLVVVIPLLAAPLCVVLRGFRLSWAVAQGATLAVFVATVVMLPRVISDGALTYRLGGWDDPWGVAFKVDAFNALIATLVSLIALVTVFYARVSVVRELPPSRRAFFYALLLLCLTGLLGITVTHDIFNAFVFLEITSLASYGLVALARGRAAAPAAFRYLIMGSIGATFFLIGIGYLYMLTGTLHFTDIAVRAQAFETSRVLFAAQVLIGVGLAMKIAIFPLHVWLPGAYSEAPSVVSAFLAATGTKVSLYLFMRLFLDVFQPQWFTDLLRLDVILMSAATIAIIYTSWQAIRATDVKRMLAFSSVGQMGYILLGFSLATTTGVTAGLLQLLGHSLTKGGLFLAVGCVVWCHGRRRLDDLRGLGQSMPWVAAAIVVGGLGLIGVPLTAGFVGKWHLIVSLIDLNQWFLIVVVLAGSLLSVAYVWRLVEAMYLSDAIGVDDEVRPDHPPATMVLSAWCLLALTLFFGMHAEDWVSWATQAAQAILPHAAP